MWTNKIKTTITFLSCLFIFISLAFAESSKEVEQLAFNPDYSHEMTKNNFFKNLKRECHKFGYTNLAKKEFVSSAKVLESYPEEIAFSYFKDGHGDLCFYAFNMLINYLDESYQEKIKPIIYKEIESCFKLKNSTAYCSDRKQDYFYTNTAKMLSRFCDKKSEKLFHKVYCGYKSFKKDKCELYSVSSYQKCPEFQSHQAETQSLLNQFYQSSCKKLKKRKITCPN